MESFRDRVVLITGAASGIGRALALRLAAEGARVAALDLQEPGLESLQRELAGKPFAWAVADVIDLAAVRAAVKRLEEHLGPIDVLIASAGIGRKTTAADFSAEEVNAHIQVNLIGVVNSIDAVLPGMRQRRRGQLAALSSLASYRGLPLLGAYCASKAGVNALFDALRVELARYNIGVTTICPGWVRTPMTARLRLPAHEILEVDVAAGIMLEAIRRRRPFIAFPWRMVWQVRLLRYLPCPLADWLAHRHLRRAARLLPDEPRP
jgi:NAD(P)-dependent dehydrogenase (short-subunit alcohol dehydrogenase family)